MEAFMKVVCLCFALLLASHFAKAGSMKVEADKTKPRFLFQVEKSQSFSNESRERPSRIQQLFKPSSRATQPVAPVKTERVVRRSGGRGLLWTFVILVLIGVAG